MAPLRTWCAPAKGVFPDYGKTQFAVLARVFVTITIIIKVTSNILSVSHVKVLALPDR